MKKLLAIILAVAAVVCCLTVSVSAAGFSVDIIVHQYTMGTGTLTADVVINGSAPLQGLRLDVRYPDFLTLENDTKITWQGSLSNIDFDDMYLGSKVKHGDNSTHIVSLVAGFVPLVDNGASTLVVSGTIATVTFNVNENAMLESSDRSFSFTLAEFIDENGKTLNTGSDFSVDPNTEDSNVTFTCTEHDYEWQSDVNGHKQVCKKCGNIINEGAHNHDGDATCQKASICTACGYEISPKLDHKAGSEWKYDGTKHWHECIYNCGTHLDEANHAGGEADCTKEATCTVCGQSYGGTNSNLHKYGEPVWTWEGYTKATAKFTCELNPEHIREETAVITSETVNATCEADGKITYTAKVTLNGKDYTDVKVDNESLKATGHKWNEGVWTWSNDGKSATLTFTCQNDGAHTRTPEVKVTSSEKIPAKCEEMGTTAYTATAEFEGKSYTDTKDVKDIPALGHNYTSEVTKEPTCTDSGVRTYTCQNDSSHTYTEEIPAKGHTSDLEDGKYHTDGENHWLHCSVCDKDYEKDAHKWSDDYKHDADAHWRTCTVCNADETHENHVAAADWTIDISGHWHKCSKCNADDVKLVFDAHTNAKFFEAVEATKEADGHMAYWYCPDCEKYFLDKDGKIVAGPFDDTDEFVVKYKYTCDDMGGHILRCYISNQYFHTYTCERQCGLLETMPHRFNANGICEECGYVIPGRDNVGPGDVVEVESPIEGTEQGSDEDPDNMDAGDTEGDNPAEANPETGLALSVIPAVLAAIILLKRR